MGLCKQLHLFRAPQGHKIKSAQYLGTELRESPDDLMESQGNADLTWEQQTLFLPYVPGQAHRLEGAA